MIGSTAIAQKQIHQVKKKQNQNICVVPHKVLSVRRILPVNQTLFIVANGPKTSLVSIKSNNKYGYGSKMRLNSNGTMTESYTTPCGNDRNIHKNVGTWKATYLKNGNIHLRTSIPIKNYGRDLVLIKQGSDYIMKPMMNKKSKQMKKQRMIQKKRHVIKHG
jgi:hypothetical protein